MLRRLATIAAALTLAACSDGFTVPTDGHDVTVPADRITVPPDSISIPSGNCHGMEPFLTPEELAKIPGCGRRQP